MAVEPDRPEGAWQRGLGRQCPPGWFGRARQAVGPDTTRPRVASQRPRQPAGLAGGRAGGGGREAGRLVGGRVALFDAARRWKHSLVVATTTRNDAVAVDRQMVARTVQELRTALPE